MNPFGVGSAGRFYFGTKHSSLWYILFHNRRYNHEKSRFVIYHCSNYVGTFTVPQFISAHYINPWLIRETMTDIILTNKVIKDIAIDMIDILVARFSPASASTARCRASSSCCLRKNISFSADFSCDFEYSSILHILLFNSS